MPAVVQSCLVSLALTAALAAAAILAVPPPAAAADEPPLLSISTPEITGTPALGETLTASTTASGPVTYLWHRAHSEISDARGTTYTLVTADVGKRVWVTATVRGDGHAEITAASVVTKKITKPFASAAKVSIAGTARVGHVLRATTTGWAPAPHFSYRWFANGKVIARATAVSYRVTAATSGKKITVRVKAMHAGYTTVLVTSSAKRVG